MHNKAYISSFNGSCSTITSKINDPEEGTKKNMHILPHINFYLLSNFAEDCMIGMDYLS